jgi:POT family proton-dependent oligopeptide transporter
VSAPGAPRQRQWFGHPPGLTVLAGTEAWERFSFYGMQTLVVLYMVDQLLRPGHVETVFAMAPLRRVLEGAMGPLSPQALASMIFGIYSGLAYFLPVFGGIVGDRWLGQHRMVAAGAILMALGHLLMAFDRSFLMALALLIVGSGCLKGNITTQVGSLYAANDGRRTHAFQIFQFGINLGVVAAPFVCGTLGERLGWHLGFAAAGIGMLLGLATYLAGRRHLPPDRRAKGRGDAAATARAAPRTVVALGLVLVVVVLFLVPGNQMGNVYPLWVRAHVDRHLGGFEIPTTWFLAGTAIISLGLTPLILRFSPKRASRGWANDEVSQLRLGTLVATAAYALLALLATVGGDAVSWLWLIAYHALFALAYLLIWPVGMSLFSRSAPGGTTAMFIGVFYTSVFFANNLMGVIGGLYERVGPSMFWSLQAAIGLCAFLLVAATGGWLRRVLIDEGIGHGS